MEPRRFKLKAGRPLILRGYIIRLVEIEGGHRAIVSVEEVGEQQPDIDMGGRKLDTKPNEH